MLLIDAVDFRVYRQSYIGPVKGSSSRRTNNSSSASNGANDANTWVLVCRTSDDWMQFPNQFASSRNASERAFHEVLVETMVPSILPDLQAREKMQKKNDLLANMPRKRSARIQTMVRDWLDFWF